MNPQLNARQHPAALLQQNDYDYFDTAAVTQQLFGGCWSHLPGFEQIPAGGVFYDIDPSCYQGRETAAVWLDNVEQLFINAGTRLIRLYLTQSNGILSSLLTARGYRSSLEVGLVLSTADMKAGPKNEKIVRCDSAELIEAQKEMSSAQGTGPDGHAMCGSLFFELEQKKIKAGYMTSYAFCDNGNMLGAVKLSSSGSLCRIKNLIVHSGARRCGVASQLVEFAKEKARAADFEWLGAYALQGGAGEKVYQKAGMVEVTRQYEWVKPVVP